MTWFEFEGRRVPIEEGVDRLKTVDPALFAAAAVFFG